jgi:uncharacterized membrane protein
MAPGVLLTPAPTIMNDSVTLQASVTAPARPPIPDRLESVDLLRGIVMVLMALDHIRDYLHFGQLHGFDPLDLKTTTVPLFFTRWITHFCAPVFIFLAGTGAFLSGSRGKSKAALSWFLFTRGLWLILLELTVINWAGWSFAINLHAYVGIVIWAIGWSMIVLAGLVHLPLWAITTFGVAMIVGHNAFDAVKPESWGAFAWLWRVLHTGGPIEYAKGYVLFAGYPLIPWMGVMAAGYGFGALLTRETTERRRRIFQLGAGLTVAFLVLRVSNLYGDLRPWTTQSTTGATLLSMLDCHKYPPSLCYLLMTLGPALMLLAWLDRGTPAALKPLLVFGRVPLFYYLLHLPVVHGLAVLIETLRFGHASWLIGNPFGPPNPAMPANAGLSIAGVYATWLLAIVLLYPVCAWFAALKRRRRDAWLSYL